MLVLPAHTSHALQPYDVGLASPFKCRTRQLLLAPGSHIKDILDGLPSDAARSRFLTVHAMLSSWKLVCNSTNCGSAFRTTGMCPCSKDTALASRWVRNAPEPEQRQEDPAQRFSINGQAMTYGYLRALSMHLTGCPHPMQVTRRDILRRVNPPNEGSTLTRIPPLLRFNRVGVTLTEF